MIPLLHVTWKPLWKVLKLYILKVTIHAYHSCACIFSSFPSVLLTKEFLLQFKSSSSTLFFRRIIFLPLRDLTLSDPSLFCLPVLYISIGFSSFNKKQIINPTSSVNSPLSTPQPRYSQTSQRGSLYTHWLCLFYLLLPSLPPQSSSFCSPQTTHTKATNDL